MKDIISKISDKKINSVSRVSGGDINEAFKIECENEIYFAKINTYSNGFEMLKSEFDALKLIKQNGINVPDPLHIDKSGNENILILEWIESGRNSIETNKNIAHELYKLHSIKSNQFGFPKDNFIGKLPQINSQSDNWLEFYFSHRIEYQLKMAIDSGFISREYIDKINRMFNHVEKDLPELAPTLLHGDLWNGNYMINTEGKCIFIDPATYFGHNEIDLAMMKLFGGFDNEVFDIYIELSGLDKQWTSRLRFYQLYFILVHVNLFGKSYVGSACSIIDYYS